MLFLRASKLDTFRLRWYASQDEVNTDSEERKAHVIVANSWIYAALSCKPLVISLNVYGFDNSKLPPALFRCSSLKHLELHLSCRSINGEAAEYKYVNLPSLKKLKFGWFIINDPFMQGILSGCPLLEELELCACSLNFSEMKSDHLRCLNILACQGSGSGVVEIFMPSLVSLQFKNFYPGVKKLSFKSTPPLVKVLVWCDSLSVPEVELFNCSTTVTDLGLFGSGAEGLLQKIVLKCPIFDSLKQLTLGQWSINEKLDLLCQFLQHAPNLEKLTIIDKKDSVLKRHTLTGKSEKKGATGQIPFRCDQLKVIEIKYSDLTGWLELVDTLLQNISRRSVSVVYTKLPIEYI
ncbi:F-box/RNI-like superfamily protein [Rhynchospora pubera]|uniref:F-box/RNI-like superfamily protein n=1 Tax=Rhynchospora pubera TaxID=906938 RepID=A0AAV8F4F4_9POAL|nr:F-box/RNI-like superfamily protein [Rhynchospora pubera]